VDLVTVADIAVMAVLDYGRDNMLAVHLVKTYCLPILFYGCEIWCMSPSDKHKVDVAWNNCYGRPMEQGRPLYFHPVVSFFFFFYLFLFLT